MPVDPRQRAGAVTWVRVNKYAEAMQTPRGTYHVSAGRVIDRWRFTAWPPKPPAPPENSGYRWQDHVHNSLGCFDDAASAKRCCEEHAGVR